MDLFEKNNITGPNKSRPLADRMRPTTLENFVGQEHLLAEGKILNKAIQSDQLVSMILWGPPGVGKTTLARIIASETKSQFFYLLILNHREHQMNSLHLKMVDLQV